MCPSRVMLVWYFYVVAVFILWSCMPSVFLLVQLDLKGFHFDLSPLIISPPFKSFIADSTLQK